MRFIIFVLLGLQIPCTAQSYSLSNDVKRIVFLGNSITYSGKYISYIDAYFTILYPEKHFEFINLGLPSETVSGLSEPNHADGKFARPDLHERLERLLVKIKPDLVLACYGMNDGIYMPFDEDRFHKYKEGMGWLHDQILKSGASLLLITPPVFDERKGKAYSNVLDIYSDWLISCRYTSNWEVIDIHWPMKKYLEEQRLTDSLFLFADDGIHPNEIGHFIITKQILLYLGETEFANAKDIKNALSNYENGDAILNLIEKRQKIVKDAWLTFIGHKRPGMEVGLPITEANTQCVEINKQIQALLKQ